MPADAVVTFGADDSEFRRDVARLVGTTKAAAKEAGIAGGHEAGQGFGEGILHASHSVGATVRKLHHTLIGAVVAAGVVYEALKIGMSIGEAFWSGIGLTADREQLRVMADMEQRVEATRKRIAASQTRALEEANRIRPGGIDTEALTEKRAALKQKSLPDDLELWSDTVLRKTASGRPTVVILREENRELQKQVDGITGRARSIRENAEAEAALAENSRATAEAYKAGFEMMGDAVQAFEAEQRRLADLERETARAREESVQRYIELNQQLNDDSAQRFRQQESERRLEEDFWRDIRDNPLSPAKAAAARTPSGSLSGVAAGGSVFGQVFRGSTPVEQDIKKLEQHAKNIGETLKQIQRATQTLQLGAVTA